LTHEIARGRHQANVTAAAQRFGDRDAKHHLGLAGAGGRLEEEFELAARELSRNLVDGARLIFREREALTGLDQFVRERDRVFVGVDAFPNRAGGLV